VGVFVAARGAILISSRSPSLSLPGRDRDSDFGACVVFPHILRSLRVGCVQDTQLSLLKILKYYVACTVTSKSVEIFVLTELISLLAVKEEPW
jgi:hypothetical protein